MQVEKWKKPKTVRKYTLFGFGQHYGSTNCDRCGTALKRGSGIQRYCGPYYDKESCAYKQKNDNDRNRYYLPKKSPVIYVTENKGIQLCSCGRKYLQTRINQVQCLYCIQYETTR